MYAGKISHTLASNLQKPHHAPAAAAAVASRVSLRRVQISPLGVSRKVTPPAPRGWGLIPLLAGIPLFLYAVSTELGRVGRGPGPKGSVQPALGGLVLIMLASSSPAPG